MPPVTPRNDGDASELVGTNVLGGFLSLSGGEFVARAVAFLGTAWLTRRLGAEGFGVIGFATALCSYLALSVTAGFGSLGAREVARRPERAAALAGGVVLLRLVLAVAAVALTALVALSLNKPPVVRWAVLLTSLSFLPLALETGWVYKGLGRVGRLSVALVLAQLLYVAAIFVFVRVPSDLLKVPLCQVAGELGGAALLLAPFLAGLPRPDLAAARGLLRESLPLMTSRLLRTLIFTFDVVLLGFLLGERPVGIYAAAYRFCMLVLAVAWALHVSYLPLIVRAAERGRDAVSAWVSRALDFVWALATPMVVGGAVLGAPLLGGLFGGEYSEGARAFAFLLLSCGFIFLHGVFHNVALVYDKLRAEMWIMAAGASANVALNLVLIRPYGIVGAAIATAAAEALILILYLMVIARVGIRARIAAFLRVLAATAGMAALLIWSEPYGHWLLRLAAGAVVYCLLLVLLRAVPEEVRERLSKR